MNGGGTKHKLTAMCSLPYQSNASDPIDLPLHQAPDQENAQIRDTNPNHAAQVNQEGGPNASDNNAAQTNIQDEDDRLNSENCIRRQRALRE